MKKINESGQSTVEFALTVPVLMLVLLALLQAGLIAHAQIMVTHAAREGARQAATADSDGEILQAARKGAAGLESNRLDVSFSAPSGWKAGEPVTVRTTYDVPVFAPFLKKVINGAVGVGAQATMRIEKERQ